MAALNRKISFLTVLWIILTASVVLAEPAYWRGYRKRSQDKDTSIRSSSGEFTRRFSSSSGFARTHGRRERQVRAGRRLHKSGRHPVAQYRAAHLHERARYGTDYMQRRTTHQQRFARSTVISVSKSSDRYASRRRHRGIARRRTGHSGLGRKRIYHRRYHSRPRYKHIVYYHHGPYYHYRYTHPGYHKKYLFISFNGYWPSNYRYRRYWWYSYHPYRWYGYRPQVYIINGTTDYYTYDSYYEPLQSGEYISGVQVPDYEALADVRRRLEQTETVPAEATAADDYFEQAVEAFEKGDYALAGRTFQLAHQIEPDDFVLTFAYTQSLFAEGKYVQAADALKSALANGKGVFFARGLYSDDGILHQHIELLEEAVQKDPYNADLQLLLGYELLGAERYEAASKHLRTAQLHLENRAAAKFLIEQAQKFQEADK